LLAGLAEAKKVKLPNGKVLIDPYVISRRPDGLEIGHKTGIMFVKFTNMPVEIQKKYGYDPKKAADYERKQAKRKQALAREKKEKAEKQRRISAQLNRNLLNASINDLEIKIKEAENRVAFLKKEIPRIQKEADRLLNSSTKLAGKNVSGDNNNRNRSGLYYGWDGGYVLGNSSGDRQAESTKRRQLKRLGDDYSAAKRRLEKYQKELLAKQNEIIRMKSRLKKKKAMRKK
jgi:chromosome segregation ATPase